MNRVEICPDRSDPYTNGIPIALSKWSQGQVNLEAVLMVDQPVVYARLLEVFLHDWALGTR